MANKIILKKTSTASKVPLSTDLEVGEIAVNLADQKLYSKDASGTVILVGQGAGGAGDVTGGSSSTDNALARYDGTTGKVIQNSVVIVDDTGSITGVNALTAQSLVVNNNATIGSSNTDTLDVRSRISSDLDPETNNAKDIGSNGRNWRDGFFGRTLHTANIEVTGTTSFDGSQGTSGQVLTSAGTGNTPTWTTPTTGTVTSVGGTGTVNGISLSGTVTSSGNLTLGGTLSGVSLTTQVTDTLPIANGGTGQTTANASLNALLPSQTGNSGKVLSTDGTNTSWISGGGGGGSFFSPYIFTATASQTTFAVGVALDAVQVYVNGVLQVPSTDYSISGTSIVLTTGAPVGAIVQVNVYTAFSVADTYSTAVIDTNFASKTSLGDLAYLDTVGTSQIDNTSVTVAKLNATGTPSSTTYLRGDGSWAVPSSLLAGQVIETISSVCDGSVITVQSGTYTIQNVTTQQGYVGATYTDINGSVLSYTPPVGTTRVEYEFEFASYWVSAHAINDYIFFIDGVEVVFARHNRSGYYPEFRFPFKWTIAIGGTPNANTGRIASWTTPKIMKMQYRQYGGSNYNNLHGTTYWNGTSGNQFSMPHIKITAIA